jgi:exosortase H (IPTLxxWG-CTERM-specific)
MKRFFIVFLLLQAALFSVELLRPVRQFLVVPWTELLALLGAKLIQAFDAQAVSQGVTIRNATSGLGVSIQAGCNGVEACIVLVAATLAFPAPWRFKAIGALIGVVAVQLVNMLRIVSLFYLVQWHQAWFEFAHLYLWQALIMLDVLVVWLLWVRYVARHTPAEAGNPHAA